MQDTGKIKEDKEMLRKMNEQEKRQANGGSAYCKVCNYGRHANYSDWKVMAHIAARHPAAVLRGMGRLIGKIFG